MASQLRLLDSDGVSSFASHTFGNVLAGTQSIPKLLFMDSYGDAAALSAEAGIEAVAGNDGYSFAELCEAATMTAIPVTVTGSVVTSGGNIIAGTVIEYRVAVKDRWGHESELCAVSFSPSFVTGNTNRVDLSWDAVDGFFKYILYSNIGGAGYFKVAETTTNTYSDLFGTNDGATVPKAGGSVAYKVGTWTTSAIVAGDMAAGTQKPIAYRVNIGAGTTSTGNPRQFKAYVAMLTV